MKKNIFQYFFLLIGCCLYLSVNISAQNKDNISIEEECGTDQSHEYKMKTDPAYAKKHNKIEEQIYQRAIEYYNSPLKSDDNVQHTIPVVFHLVHNTTGTSAADLTVAQIESALQYLNDAFANANGSNTTTGVDINLDFCFAAQDENGDATNGIDTIINNNWVHLCMEPEADPMKNTTSWNTNNYMNIWVVETMNRVDTLTGNCTRGIAGNSTYPSSHGNSIDGIIIEYDKLLPPNIPINEARSTFPHEVGHYFNLYHTNEGGCSNNDCLTEGDFVCDTPPALSNNCNSGLASSCATDADDPSSNNPFTTNVDDLTDNYLARNGTNCRFNFTPGQRVRMRCALVDVRASLLTSPACCVEPIAAFEANAPFTGVVTFTNTSIDGNSCSWDFGDGSTSTNCAPGTHSYTQSGNGTYTVCLTVTNTCSTDEFCDDVTIDGLPDPCIENLVLSENIGPSGIYIYEADNSIETSQTLQGVLSATYQSDMILLTDGFCAPSTSVVCIQEGVCGGGSSNMKTNDLSPKTTLLANTVRNYPDPFSTSTIIEYELMKEGNVSIIVYDALGKPIQQLVDNETKNMGIHQVTFEAQNLPDGMYFYAIQVGELLKVERMMLAR